jgi:hypothetical protein
MARQTGIIKIKGKIGDLSFYKTQDGHLVREKGGVDADRIKNDPSFVRTRENGEEFGSSAASGKLLRDTLRPMMMSASDGRVTARVMKVMSQIKNLDDTSIRGKRNVGLAIAKPEAKVLLNNFNFNKRSILGSVLFKPFTVDTSTGLIDIPNVVPVNDIAFPSGATHVSFRGAWARVDFELGLKEIEYSPVNNFPLDATSNMVKLTPAAAPTGTGTDIYLLMLEFFQEMNGVQYSLKNGSYNVLSVVEVA